MDDDGQLISIGKLIRPEDLSTPSAAEVWGSLRSPVQPRESLQALGEATREKALKLAQVIKRADRVRQATRESPQTLTEVLGQLDSLEKDLQAALDSARKAIVSVVVTNSVKRHVGMLRRWASRWGSDWPEAEQAFRRIALKAMTDQDYRRQAAQPLYGSEYLDDKDLAIAELYYYAEMTQADIGKLIGLSQPAVGGRLNKIARSIGQELLMKRVIQMGLDEGWDLTTSWSILGGVDLSFDIMATKRYARDKVAELGIELKVVSSSDDPALDLHWFTEIVPTADDIGLELVLGLAFYNLSDRSAGLLLQRDIIETMIKATSKTPLTLDVVKALLPSLSLSLDAALKRATK